MHLRLQQQQWQLAVLSRSGIKLKIKLNKNWKMLRKSATTYAIRHA